tara:strand:- start:9132 stop:9278 length:147 start_codon:yes stop_codon:yes gene_type:complete
MNTDSGLKIALDATAVLNRIAKAMPELEIHLVVSILLERIERVMEAEK